MFQKYVFSKAAWEWLLLNVISLDRDILDIVFPGIFTELSAYGCTVLQHFHHVDGCF